MLAPISAIRFPYAEPRSVASTNAASGPTSRNVGSRLREDRLCARLAPHQAADLPGVKASGVERHHPAREPEEELERGLPLEGGRARPEQQHGRPHGRLRPHAAELAEGRPERSRMGELRDPDAT